MCGINGIFGLENLPDPVSLVSIMNDRLAHRGPDAHHIFSSPELCLGHRRLSIIDLSHEADQPMSDSQGRYTISYNGEIYNYKEIRARFPEKEFKTNSDTEVVLAAYAHYGPACLQLFNGMFAMAIWDDQEKSLFLARDRAGIKPLYYAFEQGTLIFSSEIRSILSAELFKPTLDRESLWEYLMYQTVHEPRTILQGISMLPAGHHMLVKDNELNINKYWDVAHSYKRYEGQGKKQIHEDISQLVKSSVERRLIADVPFGAFLSGGVDSSLLTAVMSEVGDTQVKTFTVTFDESEFNEARYARMVAERFNTDHTEIRLTPQNFLELIPEALAAMDHPSGDGPNTYAVSKVTREAGVTMAISGLGGDELFAGYPHFKHCLRALDKQWLTVYPVFMRKVIGSIMTWLKNDISTKKAAHIISRSRMDMAHIYPVMRQVLMEKEVEAIIEHTPVRMDKVKQTLQENASEWNALDHISHISLAEINTYMRHVLLRDSDQMGMAHALEIRVPFLDHELIEYVLGIPDEFKTSHRSKQLLIESFEGLLPKQIVDRPKMGFTLPWIKWLKEDLKDFCSERINAFDARNFVKTGSVVGLWNRFLKDDPVVTWSRVWHIVVLENWLQEHDVEA